MFPFEIVNSLTKPPSPFRFSLSGRRKGRVSLARFDPRQTEEEEGVRERAPHHGLKHGPFVAGWTKEVTQRHVYSATMRRECCLRNAVSLSSLKRAKRRSFLSSVLETNLLAANQIFPQ